MCGIAGYSGSDQSLDTLHRMTKALERRGPDDEGFHLGEGVGFGFRRLSIIDVSGGHQPMSNEDGSIWVMMNGEIYGFGALRDELLGLDHVFTTKSDTEVVVHAYEQFGDECFTRLNGMFAIAIWDSGRRRLVLARDRLGKKPLYWTESKGTLWFASEIKSLLASGSVSREIDFVSLALFFRTDCVPTPRSIFKNVHKLEPATAMAWVQGKVEKVWSFWKPSLARFENVERNPKDIVGHVGTLIDRAVSERLVSDVPLGLFLSGGLDSAVVAESAARQGGRIQAFTMGSDDQSHDETALARKTAEALGLEHRVKILTENHALAMVDQAVNLLDEPLADASILPTLLLSEFAREHVTAALSGDGGDELLLGYQHLGMHRILNSVPCTISGALGALRPILDMVPAGSGYFTPGFKAQRLARGLGTIDPWARDVRWRGATTGEDLGRLLLPEVARAAQIDFAETQLKSRADGICTEDFWQRWSWAYLRTFLMDEVMVKVDRATMWFSLEARAPLLDVGVVEYLLSLPADFKLGPWGGKRLFKELLRGKVPEAVLNGKKHGFAVPVGKWLNGRLGERLDNLVSPERLARQGIFDAQAVGGMLKEHRSGKRDRRKELWAMFMFQSWYDKWTVN